MRRSTNLWAGSLALTVGILGCDKKEEAAADAATTSAPEAAAPVQTAAASSSAPAASASAELPPSPDCPKGSAGPGTFDKPCEAKGAGRMMEAVWTGKTDDKGPHFRVTNKFSKPILYGKIAVYFYDKAGKQLEVKAGEDKTRSYQPCGGNIFSGVMKAGEKAVITFSCVKKDHVPEGTAAIEAELETVGFADASEKRSELYWRNKDLVPNERKKGGVKK